MALLSIPLLAAVGISLGSQVYDEIFPTNRGDHASYSCDEDVDLRRAGQSMHGMSFLDQGDTNLCAPYAAAELIDAWRSAHRGSELKPAERTSPMALALEFAAKNDWPYSAPIQSSTDPLARDAGRWGGIVCVFASSAREIGVCSDQVLRETQGKSLEAIAKTDALFTAIGDYLALKPKLREEKRPRMAARIHTILSALPPLLERGTIPSVTRIEEELTFFTGDDPYVPMSRLLLGACRKYRASVADLPVCQSKIDAGLDAFGWSHIRVPFREASTFKTVKKLLGREKPTPVAFAYCHKVVRQGRKYRPTSILSSECTQHWSLIIGSRQSGGRCQFLVRDTDGGKPDRISADWDIDRGDVWVDSESLMRATYLLQWLE